MDTVPCGCCTLKVIRANVFAYEKFESPRPWPLAFITFLVLFLHPRSSTKQQSSGIEFFRRTKLSSRVALKVLTFRGGIHSIQVVQRNWYGADGELYISIVPLRFPSNKNRRVPKPYHLPTLGPFTLPQTLGHLHLLFRAQTASVFKETLRIHVEAYSPVVFEGYVRTHFSGENIIRYLNGGVKGSIVLYHILIESAVRQVHFVLQPLTLPLDAAQEQKTPDKRPGHHRAATTCVCSCEELLRSSHGWGRGMTVSRCQLLSLASTHY